MKKIVMAVAFVAAVTMVLNAASTHLTLDNRTGTRIAAATERIRFSLTWETEVAGATAVVSIDGVAVKEATEPGAFDWTPTQGGTNLFTHAVFVNGVQVGKTLSATFVVPEFAFEYFEQTGHAYVKSYSGTAERVEIPSVVYVDVNGRQVVDEASAAKTYQVVGISNSGFARNKTMKSVVFPASLQTIGSEAFYGCESLEQVTVPETVTSIGESAFTWCPKLKRAEVLGALELSANCFAYDSTLETVVIGDKVTSLQKGYKDSDGALGSPFLGCEKLREISVGSGITYILPYVFSGLKSLETIRFGAVIRDVYHHAFSGCESLKTIVGTLRPLSVGDSAFSGVPAYFGAQFDDCTTVGTAAFWNCRGFGGTGETHTLDLPKITSIGDGAFEGCVNMSAVQLGATLKTIGANAFKDSGAQVVCFDGPPPSVGEGAFALSGEPQGVLRNWDSWQDWQSAIDINTGMWHGLHFSQVVGSAAYAAYTFRAIDDTVGTFDPKKVTAIVNMRLSGEGNTATYAEIQRCQLDPMGVCYVPTCMGGDYEVWFVYDDETWKCTIDNDCFSAPLERDREMTVYFRRGNPAWMVTVYLYADEKAMDPYAKLSLSSSADAGQDFPAPELSPVELSIGVLPTPPWPTPTWLYEFSGWRRRHYNVQSGKWETGDPIPATVYLGQSEIDQGNSLHLVATWKWDLGGGDDFKTWEEVQTEEYDKVVVKSAKIKDGETSEFSVTVEDEGVFSFLWKTSTESGCKFASVSALRNLSNVAVPTWDHAEFLVDGEVVATRDGESQWEKVTVNLSGGSPHTVTWRYAKDASGSAGEDCVWVSDIQLAAFPELVIKGNVLMGFRGTVPDGYELIIPDGVTVVSEGSFEECKELKSVTFPMGVTVIGDCAFRDCGELISVTLPPSVTEIRDEAFCDCAKLGSVTIPSSVTKLGRNAFEGTALLAGYPDGPVVVDDCLIAWKGKCSGSVEIPDGVRLIADEVFDEREELTSVKIPSSVTSIGDGAFLDCCSLMSVTIHEGVTSIGKNAFGGCSGLTSVTIPKGVTSIGSGAFYDCNSLTSVTIPSSVTSIGSEAFAYCDSLTSINIPSSVTSIGDDAFYDCSGLGSGVVIVDGCVLTVNGKCPSVVELPKGTRLIGGGAFTGCRDLTSVTIPSSVTSIGDDAFGGCSGLTSVTIPEGVMSIGEQAFCDCSSLTSVILPSSVTSIEPFTFEGCDSLTSVTIPEGVTSIGDWAFCDCIGLTSVNIPSSVTNISDAFCGCSGLGSGVVVVDGCVLTVNGECPSVVVLPKGTRLIGGGAFFDCSGLTSVTIPEGVTIIGEGAFRRCRNLTSVTIPSSVTGIGRTVFYDCSSLTSVTIPEGVTSIEESAFSYCSGLTSVTIPSSVTSIAYNAFACCNEFKTVYVCSGDVERIKNLLKQSGFSISGVFLVEVGSPAVGPAIEGDEGATVTGDAETGFVIRPSEGKTTVEVTIPQGVDAAKVTVEVEPDVQSVKPNGAKVKIVSGGADITEFLNIPAADGNGAIDLASATVKEEIVKETMDPSKGAKIELNATDPKLKTAATREGLFYQLREGETLEGMKDGDFTVGDGQPWSPSITVKGGNSAFYSIDVRKNMSSFIIIRRLVDF